MRPIPGAAGEPVNWINYKTGVRGFYFRMDADNSSAGIAIDLKHSENDQLSHHYAHLRQLRMILEQETGEEWQWKELFMDENGITISRIRTTLEGVNVFNQADWPAIISFFKPRIMALDRFWNRVKEGFE